MSKQKINVAIGVATGILVGFVLGITFGLSEPGSLSAAHAEGNVSLLSKQRLAAPEQNVSEQNISGQNITEQNNADQKNPADQKDSTICLSATDNEGNNWEIIVNKK